jgi:hypothetical protein
MQVLLETLDFLAVVEVEVVAHLLLVRVVLVMQEVLARA